MHLGFKNIASFIIGGLLIIIGVLPVFGISLFSVTGDIYTGILMVALIFMVVDGFGEEHALKTITLLTGLVMGLIVAIPLLNGAGLIPFGLPGVIIGLTPWVIGATGTLLIIGTMKA